MAEPFMRESLDPKKHYEGIQGHRGSLRDKFNDIDDPTYFRQYMHLLKEPETQNFVLDFGNEDAYCATDLVTDDFKALLSQPVCLVGTRPRDELTISTAIQMFWYTMDVRLDQSCSMLRD